MRQIFQEFGGLMITAVVGLVMIVVFFGLSLRDKTGMNRITGDFMEAQTSEKLQDASPTAAYEQFGTAEVETVLFDSAKTIYEGREICLDDYFSVVASDGSRVGFQVLDIRDEGGKKNSITYKDGAYYVRFYRPGIYRIRMKTVSDHIRQREAIISFPVEQGG